jgi:hypothetical protein
MFTGVPQVRVYNEWPAINAGLGKAPSHLCLANCVRRSRQFANFAGLTGQEGWVRATRYISNGLPVLGCVQSDSD